MEIWKDVNGFEGLYQVSNRGNIRSLDRIRNKWDGQRLVKGKLLKAATNLNGYRFIYLYTPQNKPVMKTIHRLVAEAFIPNPNSLSQINHKNEIKTDNRVENLEWCDALYNVNYGSRTQKAVLKMVKPVVVYGANGERIGEYSSLKETAEALGLARSTICCYLKGIFKNSNGLTFKYK